MAEPYDEALRERAVAAYETGRGGSHELASLFKVGYRTLERWVARKRATGSVAADPKRGGWRSPIEMAILLTVADEHRARAASGGLRAQKKRPRPSECDRPDVAAKRAAFLRWMRRIDPRRL